MNYKDIQSKSVSQLYEMLCEYKKELFNLRLQKSLLKTTINLARFSVCRKNIARIKTHLRQIQLGVSK
jgi:ribosomal protein L29